MARTKVILVAIAFAIVGFLLNPNAPLGGMLFGAPPEGSGPSPSGAQIAALMVVALVESIAFGVGVALLAFGLPRARRLIPRAGLATAAWIAVVWLLVSWVPHTAMHQTAGRDFAKLVAIEYAFHVTLVAGGAILAWALTTGAREEAHAGEARAVRGATMDRS